MVWNAFVKIACEIEMQNENWLVTKKKVDKPLQIHH